MANTLYDKGREGFLDGSIDWDTDNIKVVMLNSAYAFSQTHDNLDDISAFAIVDGTSGNLASKTKTNGVADAADVVIAAPNPSDELGSVVVFKDTGTPATSRLIAYYDQGLPMTLDGSAFTIEWPSSTNRMFKI